jgi:phage FluMu protein Com
MLEKVRKDQLDRSCEKCKSITQSQRGNEHHTRDKKRAKWVGHSFFRNCLLKQVISGNIEKKERQGRRCKQLLDDFKEMKKWNLKEEALDRTL